MNNKQIVLFDIDHTLFNGELYREKVFSAMAEKLPLLDHKKFINVAEDEFWKIRKNGPFFPKEYAKNLVKELTLSIEESELEKVFWDENIIRSSLYEEAEAVLRELSKDNNYSIGIFSAGPPEFQKAKIKFLDQYFNQEHKHIFLLKKDAIVSVLQKYKDTKLYVLDDILSVLSQLKEANPSICTIWVKKRKPVTKEKSKYKADYEITDLREIIDIVKRK